MSATSDALRDLAIWVVVIAPFVIAILVVIRRIISGVRNPDEPVDPDRTELL